MIDLGDFRNSPLRVGGYSRKKVGAKVEVGLCVVAPLSRFPLGATVALELDGRRFVGNVVLAEERNATATTHVVLEGKFT